MFTGIIEEVGTVQRLGGGSIAIAAEHVLGDAHVGDSIAVNGICLTVTSFDRRHFTADVMPETVRRTSLVELRKGSPVNLERALSLASRLGGHIVSGHIDGTGTVVSVRRDDIAVWYTIRTTPQLMRYIVEKGSIAIDGISLTVAAVETDRFSVSIIPHTVQETTLGEKRPGATVNLENDIIGKYVEKLMQKDGGMTPEFLAQNGF